MLIFAFASRVAIFAREPGLFEFSIINTLESTTSTPRSSKMVSAFRVSLTTMRTIAWSMLSEMVSGTHPFMRPSLVSTVDAILNAATPPLDEQRPDVPPLLAHIVNRCLEKDRDRRYQSLREAQMELVGLAEGTGSVVAAPRQPLGRGLRRAAVAAVIAAAAIAAVAMWARPDRFGLSPAAAAFNERDWILISDFENRTGPADHMIDV